MTIFTRVLQAAFLATLVLQLWFKGADALPSIVAIGLIFLLVYGVVVLAVKLLRSAGKLATPENLGRAAGQGANAAQRVAEGFKGGYQQERRSN